INRRALDTSVELRPPALERVFDHKFFGLKLKHVIEPSVVYRYVTGVNDFSRLLRFDERDVLSDTNEVEYRVVNRLYAKGSSSTTSNCNATDLSFPNGRRSQTGAPPWAQTGAPPWEEEEGNVPEPESRQTDCPVTPPARSLV